MQNSPQYIIGYFGHPRANAVVVPVNPEDRSAKIQYLIETPSPRPLWRPELLEHTRACRRRAFTEGYRLPA